MASIDAERSESAVKTKEFDVVSRIDRWQNSGALRKTTYFDHGNPISSRTHIRFHYDARVCAEGAFEGALRTRNMFAQSQLKEFSQVRDCRLAKSEA